MRQKKSHIRMIALSLNHAPELTGIGKYNGEMCSWLAEHGDVIKIICAPPYYPEWAIHEDYSGVKYRQTIENGVFVTRCPLYVPKKPSTIKRIIHLASFAISSIGALIINIRFRPDIVFVTEPSIFVIPAALLYSKLTGAKSILHVQDYEVDAMFGLRMANRANLLARLLYRIETFLMRRFAMVSTISHSMLQKAERKGVDADNLVLFPNWSDLEFINPDVDGQTLRKEWGISEKEKLVLYAGNVGAKQGLDIVVSAASIYKSRPEVRFFIVGSGAYIDDLKEQVKKNKLTNVVFKPLQDWKYVPAMLAMTDVHLVVQKRGAADAVLPSKLTNILSVGGHALVTADPHTELGLIAERNPGIYTCVEPENINEFCSGLELELNKSGVNHIAREYALRYLEKNSILNSFREKLLTLAGC